MTQRSDALTVGLVSTCPPRRCGLATYTADLRQALSVADPAITAVTVAVDRDRLPYPDDVLATIHHDDVTGYAAAADALAEAGTDVVLIQHEYGIFGGRAGAHVLGLARALVERGIPYLVTLHTVRSAPSAGQAATLRALCAKAARVTVFTQTARRIAISQGLAAERVIAVVTHGAPVELRALAQPHRLGPDAATALDPGGTGRVLTSFGLLGPGKGLDVAIRALPRVLPAHPDVRYVVAGGTHPEIVRRSGEAYRRQLTDLVDELGLGGHVRFLDRFLTVDEIAALLRGSTLTLTPYRDREKVCSGTLTFALAAGCPVVSTGFRYAVDMLRAGAGRLVPFDDPDALADEVNRLLDDPDALDAARGAADTIGARLTWPAVAVRVAGLLRDVVEERRGGAAPVPVGVGPVPVLNLNHLDKLTDGTGVVGAVRGDEPVPDGGYRVEDVARLAVVSAGLLAVRREPQTAKRWLRLCLRLLRAAHRPPALHAVLGPDGTWRDEPHPGDHVGLALWGLGAVAGTAAVPGELRRDAAQLLDELAPLTTVLTGYGLRAVAYAVTGLSRAGRVGDHLAAGAHHLAEALATGAAEDPARQWHGPVLTGDDARLPQALLASATLLGRTDLAAQALRSLDWLVDQLGLADGVLRHPDAGTTAERPVDAAAMVDALVAAWYETDDGHYARLAGWAYHWFLGRNRAGVRLYSDTTGGCHDGLRPTGDGHDGSRSHGVARDQGAGSTLAYHQALLSLVRAGLAELPQPPAAGRYRVVLPAGTEVSGPRRAPDPA